MQLELTDPRRPAWLSVILIFGAAMIGFNIIGPLIGFFFALPFIEGDVLSIPEKLTNPAAYPEIKIPFYIIQGSGTLIGLILLPMLYIKAVMRKEVSLIITRYPIHGVALGLTAIILVTFMVANSFFIEWNAGLHLPDFMSAFEEWARRQEDLLGELTQVLTSFDTTGEFIIAFFVIAVLAGIGEELVFRGMLQPELHRATKNIHVAIWISAILFSGIHMQFFGFVPRMLLGVLFGYLYYWSGNILVPMFAHFLNNAVSVIMIYLYQLGAIDIDMDSTESAPITLVMLFTIITFGLLLYLKNFYKSRNPELS
jgi:hypothetical protein